MRPFSASLLGSLFLVILSGSSSTAWISQAAQPRIRPYATPTRLHEVLQGPGGVTFSLKEEGEKLIRSVLINQGCSDDQFQIDWKPEKIIITIKGMTYLQDDNSDDEIEEVLIESEAFFDPDLDEIVEAEVPHDGTNIVELSRAIRSALESDTAVGVEIGEKFEIEVTTPGAPDELSGIMFQSYKGFDVIVEYFDAKKDKIVFLDGRLVERNDENTIINIKGRMKKLSNDIVKAVRLPKAKKEKGS
ncbi:hypothetical protein FisN_9Lh306 [Fistulifera solaris]|uniref:Uncharacterized protein n=1 Tax=Fistulifera solaris TaxID=1519565 RepID=A0A1Z5KLE3_FISSO|nr:hypothetical protein FisN_9Lh306 [Fistulifera solaris]|eukprot:GAX26997.1 hypothetical protein FisN_9Lh306 [Fistulifera solaris]